MLELLLFKSYVNDRSNQIRENVCIIQHADDCLLSCSDSKSEIALNRLQENNVDLEYYFFPDPLDLNDSKTELITLSRENDKRLQNSNSCSRVI